MLMANSIEMKTFKSGIVIAGFESKIQFFQKNDAEWSMIWAIEIGTNIELFLCNDQNSLITVSADGDVGKLTEEQTSAILTPITRLVR